jgi:dynein light chain LC8-type
VDTDCIDSGGVGRAMAEKIVEKSGILERKAIIKNADMTEDMQQDAIECATAVCVLYPLETSTSS